MASGKTGLGTAKHRKSGNAGRSPKYRHQMKREAEQNEVKARPDYDCESVEELLKR